MTAPTYRTTSARPAPITPDPATVAFIDRHYDPTQQGYFWLGYIDGDPSISEGQPGHSPMREEWYRWPAERSTIEHRYAELAARGFNTYAAPCLFKQRRRIYAAARPSSWLWQDEAPAGVECSELIETSAGNYQAWIELDQALPATDRAALQKRWRAASAGADGCSSDGVHPARMPGGLNTKRHGAWVVRVARSSPRVFAVDALQNSLPPIADAPADVTTPEIERWHGNLDQLLGADGMPRRWTQNAKGRRILAGEITPPSTSEARYHVIASLVYFGYPNDEIMVLAAHLADFGASARKGSDWLYADIARCIIKARAQHPDVAISPSIGKATKPPQALPLIERPRKGRPAGDRVKHLARARRLIAAIEPDELGRRCFYVGDLAERCKVARSTFRSYLAELEQRGELARGQVGKNGQPYVITTIRFGALDKSAKPDKTEAGGAQNGALDTSAAPGIGAPQTAIEQAPCIEESHAQGSAPASVQGGAPAPSLRSLVCSYFAGLVVDESTGVIGKHTRRALAAHLSAASAAVDTTIARVEVPGETRAGRPRSAERFADRRLESLYQSEGDHARRRRQWAQLLASLPTMKYPKLTRLDKRCQRIIMEGPSGPEGERYRWACRLSPYITAELERRAPAVDRLRPLGKGRRSVTVDEVLLLAELNEARRSPASAGPAAPPAPDLEIAPAATQPDMFADAPPGAPGGCASPQPTLIEQPDGWGMIARLMRAKEQRQRAAYGGTL